MTQFTVTAIEEWRPLYVFGDKYEVSSLGNIKSVERIINGRRRKSVVLYQYKRPNGYLSVALRSIKLKKSCKIHIAVSRAFLGNPPDGYCVNHIDGNKTNNVLVNLEYVSWADNLRHAGQLGLMPRGESIISSKLTEDQVRSVRRRLATQTLAEIAIDLGVSVSCIRQIANKQTWRHVS